MEAYRLAVLFRVSVLDAAAAAAADVQLVIDIEGFWICWRLVDHPVRLNQQRPLKPPDDGN